MSAMQQKLRDLIAKLAERAAQSTREISGMIAGIQNNTQQAVHNMHSATEEVAQGANLAREAGQTMTEIRENAEKVVLSAGEISNTLRELSAASSQIAGNVENIAQMTEQNHSAVQEVSAAASGLSELADSLQQDSHYFKIT
jgi:methyl-accepting chemotaxis protein